MDLWPKLPLSTTYVTFMVAMGTSLADRAWRRESAVYRITGVLSVIGGWLITAGVAFLTCALVVAAMYYGGVFVAITLVIVAVVLLIRSNIQFRRKQREDTLIITSSRSAASASRSSCLCATNWSS